MTIPASGSSPGGKDPVGDIQTQTTQVLERIDRLLHSAGTDKSKLLTAQVWLSDMKLFAEPQCRLERMGRRRESAGARMRRRRAVASVHAGRNHGHREQVSMSCREAA